MFSFGFLLLFGVLVFNVEGASNDTSLHIINNELIRLIDDCTVGDPNSCANGECCTKKYLTYPSDYTGDKPVYQLECQPLRKTGEFCYFKTPEQFCPCQTRCHTNGFYGSCL